MMQRWAALPVPLLSFLPYDLLLIGPFLALLGTIKPQFEPGPIVYIAVLVYSAAIAVYYLFFNSQTRAWQGNP